MEIRRLRPMWRHYNQEVPIEIVSEPTLAWFDALTPLNGSRLARFAVLQSGHVMFGDAFYVLHADMSRVGLECWYKEDGVTRHDGWFEALVGGSIVFNQKTNIWCLGLLQYYGSNRDGSIARFKPLSERLTSWKDVVKTLGNDPMEHILPSFLDL